MVFAAVWERDPRATMSLRVTEKGSGYEISRHFVRTNYNIGLNDDRYFHEVHLRRAVELNAMFQELESAAYQGRRPVYA